MFCVSVCVWRVYLRYGIRYTNTTNENRKQTHEMNDTATPLAETTVRHAQQQQLRTQSVERVRIPQVKRTCVSAYVYIQKYLVRRGV